MRFIVCVRVGVDWWLLVSYSESPYFFQFLLRGVPSSLLGGMNLLKGGPLPTTKQKPQVSGLSLAVWPWAALLASLCLHILLEDSSELGPLSWGCQHFSLGVGCVGEEWPPRVKP